MLNIMGSKDKEDFLKIISREHRSLQEEFSSLCIQWFEICSKNNYGFDGRNEYSHKFAIKMKEKGLI